MNSSESADCTRCGSLYEEMITLKAQLVEARSKLSAVAAERGDGSGGGGGSPFGSAELDFKKRFEYTTNTPPVSTTATGGGIAKKLELTNSNPSTFPFRYVPPHEFLPAPFVDAHVDWLIILDRYAQMFHAHNVARPMITTTDPAVLRSTITLLDLKVKQQERQLEESKQTIEKLRHEAAMATAFSPPVPQAATARRGGAGGSSKGQQQQHQHNPQFKHQHGQRGELEEFGDANYFPTGLGGDAMMQDNVNTETAAHPGQQLAQKYPRSYTSRGGGGDNNNRRIPRSVQNSDDEVSDPQQSPDGYAVPQRSDRIERYKKGKRTSTPIATNHNSNNTMTPIRTQNELQQQQQQQQAPPPSAAAIANASRSGSSSVLAAPPGITPGSNNNNNNNATTTAGGADSRSGSKPPVTQWSNIMQSSPEEELKKQSQPSSSTTPAASEKKPEQEPQPSKAAATAGGASSSSAANSDANTAGGGADLPLPLGWKEVKDAKSGRTYFYNKDTKETKWKRPTS